jgi:hypothetical protein
MDNKKIQIIKEEVIKSFYKNMYKNNDKDKIVINSFEDKIKRLNGNKLSKKKNKKKKNITKKK